MNLGEMERRLALIDASLQEEFAAWINDAILEIAADFDLPALKLRTPVVFPVTTSKWLNPLPSSYHKRLFKCTDSQGITVTIRRNLEDLDALDADHDETGPHVTHVAVMDAGEEKYLGAYPLANESLNLWFYEKPTVLKAPGDFPKCIPAEFHERVIFPKIIIKNYEILTDQVVEFDLKPLAYWEKKLEAGLYGRRGVSIGFINWIIKLQGGPRRHGGRDPVGAR